VNARARRVRSSRVLKSDIANKQGGVRVARRKQRGSPTRGGEEAATDAACQECRAVSCHVKA
jgi:hypothetical protein